MLPYRWAEANIVGRQSGLRSARPFIPADLKHPNHTHLAE